MNEPADVSPLYKQSLECVEHGRQMLNSLEAEKSAVGEGIGVSACPGVFFPLAFLRTNAQRPVSSLHASSIHL